MINKRFPLHIDENLLFRFFFIRPSMLEVKDDNEQRGNE